MYILILSVIQVNCARVYIENRFQTSLSNDRINALLLMFVEKEKN